MNTAKNGRGKGIVFAILFLTTLALVLASFYVTKGDEIKQKMAKAEAAKAKEPVDISIIIEDGQREFFDDKDILTTLSENGFNVKPVYKESLPNNKTQGFDVVFTSNEFAAKDVADGVDNATIVSPFYSPIAIATFEPVMEVLAREEVAENRDGHWFIDMQAFYDLSQEDVRWSDVGADLYNNPRKIMISFPKISTSNPSGGYLSILSWLANDNNVATVDKVGHTLESIAPFFNNQGYSEPTSQFLFEQYLSHGMGFKPLVAINEQQYLSELLSKGSRIKDDTTIAYMEPTVFNTNTAVTLSDNGKRFAEFLAHDVKMQELAANYGFRVNDSDMLPNALAQEGIITPPEVLQSIDEPAPRVLNEIVSAIESEGAK